MSITRAIVSLLAVATIGGAMSATSAQAQATCDWYARTALEQNKQNLDRKCGLKGLSWSSDRSAHMSWCATVSPDEWKKQAQLRDQALAKCAPGK